MTEFIKAIEADTEIEKKNRIELIYNKEKNEKEKDCKETQEKLSLYSKSIENIKINKLIFLFYNNLLRRWFYFLNNEI